MEIWDLHAHRRGVLKQSRFFRHSYRHSFLFSSSPENDLNLGQTVKIDQGTIGLGISISAIIKKIAEITHKPVVANKEGSFTLGYLPDGKPFHPTLPNYVPFSIDLGLMTLTIFTPVDQENRPFPVFSLNWEQK